MVGTAVLRDGRSDSVGRSGRQTFSFIKRSDGTGADVSKRVGQQLSNASGYE
jgi:hypothetical protein